MSEANRKVCGEGLSLALQNRDARVIGKSVSESDYGSVRIGGVGTRIEERLARMEERYQHTLPKFLLASLMPPSALCGRHLILLRMYNICFGILRGKRKRKKNFKQHQMYG